MKIADLEVGQVYTAKAKYGDRTVVVLGKVYAHKPSRFSYQPTKFVGFTPDLGAKADSGRKYSIAVAVRGRGTSADGQNVEVWTRDSVEAFQILGPAEEVDAAKAKAAADRAEMDRRVAASKAARTAAIQAQIDAAAEIGVKVGSTYSGYSGYQTVEISVEELARLVELARVGAELTAGGR